MEEAGRQGGGATASAASPASGGTKGSEGTVAEPKVPSYKRYAGFLLYIVAVGLFTIPIFISPLLASGEPGLFSFIQSAYAPTCHQLATRSLCYFQNGSIMDCAQPGANATGRAYVVDSHDVLGYKFPVCSRDVAIYGAMLLGGLAFPFVRKIDSRIAPPLIYFIIVLIPIALDGGTQLIGLRESTNELRLITGFIAGIAVPFYVIPMLNMFIIGRDKPGKEQGAAKSAEQGKKEE